MEQVFMKIKKLTPTAKIPKQQTAGSAGYDIHCDQAILMMPETSGLISIGIAIAIPRGHVGIIKSRSGLAIAGIEVGAGVIDSDYRGEVKVLLRNLSFSSQYQANIGERIAQLLIVPITDNAIFKEVDDLNDTDRGHGGFGSTNVIKEENMSDAKEDSNS